MADHRSRHTTTCIAWLEESCISNLNLRRLLLCDLPPDTIALNGNVERCTVSGLHGRMYLAEVKLNSGGSHILDGEPAVVGEWPGINVPWRRLLVFGEGLERGRANRQSERRAAQMASQKSCGFTRRDLVFRFGNRDHETRRDFT